MHAINPLNEALPQVRLWHAFCINKLEVVPTWQNIKEIRQRASAENKSITAVANAADESVLSVIKIEAEDFKNR